MTTAPSGRRGAEAPEPHIAVLCEASAWRRAFPRPLSRLRQAAALTLRQSGALSPAGRDELSLLLTDDKSQQELNSLWRGRDSSTNVLSFPDGTALPEGGRSLGDVSLAFETCRREAREQGKSLADHATHLVVHGVLHLLGHDHEAPAEAEAMEALEVRLLAELGIADPYAEGETGEAAQTVTGRVEPTSSERL
ncbi:rRNA maturation RNase YbeY [Aquibaculum sediminis]|uniref:rRNA maturation RNase YbeY n=1 Tax=Aquibaculum sediminis TaxID=3231907 RepID=UPI0034551D60